MLCNKIVIIGAGLMGTSLYNSIKQRSIAQQVVLLVKNEEQLKILAQSGITSASTDYNHAAEATLIVIATPLLAYKDILTKLQPIATEAIITDIGSVKEPVEELLKTQFKDLRFIASHPIAGSHKFGIGAVVNDLYSGKRVIITSKQDAIGVKFVTSFWEQIGMNVSFLDAKTHDDIYAHTSHLVQKIAFNVKELLEKRNLKLTTLADELNNEEFNKFIRLCSSNQRLWEDIFSNNDHYITEASNIFLTELKLCSSLVQNNQFIKLYEIIQNSRIRLGEPAVLSNKYEIASKDFLYYIFGAIIVSSLIFTIRDRKFLDYAGSGFWDIVSISHTIKQQDAITFTRVKYDLMVLLRDFYSNFK